MCTKLFPYTYYPQQQCIEIMLGAFKIRYNDDKENYSYNKAEIFNDSTGSGVSFTHVDLPDLSKLSEEELFQELVAWEHGFSFDVLIKIQQQIHIGFISNIQNIMRVKKIYPSFRGVFQIEED